MSVFYSMPAPQAPNPVEQINNAANMGNQLAQMVGGISAFTQSDLLYNIVLGKNARNRDLKENFSKNFSGKVYLTEHIFHAVRLKPQNANIEFFRVDDIGPTIENSIVILSNNNVMVNGDLNKYFNLYMNSPSSIFVIWDFDNHHWLSLSSVLAIGSDLYVPTHGDNLEALSRFNNVMAGPVPSGVIQWTKEFLTENLNIITDTTRTNEPLGTHIEYPQFINRQKVLKLLNRNLLNVKLVDGSYHGRDVMDRFTEWCSHKAHWIVPVLNDTPIRVFDALITGGIPILPRSIKYHKDVVDLHDHVLFYDYEDVQNPWPITQKANNLFDERGIQGILDRHQKVLYNYHVDNRVETILKAVQDEFAINILQSS